jgi:phosphatidylserine/phosphatidylglycerophosphate/cardiolipin synthase-like enzyme
MANTSVRGQIVDENGAGIQDLTIRAVDFDPFFSEDDVLATGKTGADGRYLLTYQPSAYSVWQADRRPDIVVQVLGPCYADPKLFGHRLLLETPEQEDVAEDVLDIGTLRIHRNAIDGWLVTHTTLNPENGEPVFLFPGNALEALVDGADLFPAVTDAASGANTSINLMSLFFQVDPGEEKKLQNSLLSKFTSDFNPAQPASPCRSGIEAQLADVLVAKGFEHKRVNVMVTDLPLSASDTVTEVRRFFKDTPVSINAFTKGFAVLHAKGIVVDGVRAILMGSPLKQFYFSDERHAIYDARHRGSLMHDVNIDVAGPAVAHIDQTFRSLWKVTDQNLTTITPDTIPEHSGADAASVQVLRTLPGAAIRAANPGDEDLPHGETGILEAYERAIHNAERYIYIETQYFTSPEIQGALLARMKDTTRSKLEIILVLNFKPDLPGYPDEQVSMVGELRAQAAIHGHQFGAYTVWSRAEIGASDGSKRFEIMPVYVHSKMAIVDDTWATVGSANLDGTSLNYHQIGLIATGALFDRVVSRFELTDDIGKFLIQAFWYVFFVILEQIVINAKILLGIILLAVKLIIDFDEVMDLLRETLGDVLTIPGLVRDSFTRTAPHALPTRSRQPPRSVELNLVIYNGIAGQPANDTIGTLRDRLWRELLGFETLPAELENVPAPSAPLGWVAAWNARAELNLQRIKDGESNPAHAPKILPWRGQTNAEDYLEALKIRTKGLRTSAEKYNFDDCKFEPKKPDLPWPI